MTSITLSSSRRPDISIFPNGRIDIAAHVARQLHLADGDVIDIAYSNREYYLYVRLTADKVVGRHVGIVHRTKAHSNNFRTNSVRLASALLTQIGHILTPLRCPCGQPQLSPDNKTIYIPIITRLAL